jgi:hypothetical protein
MLARKGTGMLICGAHLHFVCAAVCGEKMAVGTIANRRFFGVDACAYVGVNVGVTCGHKSVHNLRAESSGFSYCALVAAQSNFAF